MSRTVDLVVAGSGSAALAAIVEALQRGQQVLVVLRASDPLVERDFRRRLRTAARAHGSGVTLMTNGEVVCVDGVDRVEAVVVMDVRTGRLVAVNASAYLSCDGEPLGGGTALHCIAPRLGPLPSRSIAPLDLQLKLWQCSTMPPSGDARPELLSGTLELIVLRTLTVMGPQHAYGIAARIEQVAEQAIRVNQGTLYPALVRLEQKGWIKGAWQTTENNREARYYTITRSGVRALAEQTAWWERSAGLVNRLLTSEAE